MPFTKTSFSAHSTCKIGSTKSGANKAYTSKSAEHALDQLSPFSDDPLSSQSCQWCTSALGLWAE